MIKIRKGTFETNSSSTHSIAIPKSNDLKCKPDIIYFGLGEFGWEIENVSNADYFYTAILSYFYPDEEEIERWKNLLTALLAAEGISCEFAEPDYETYTCGGETHTYLENCYVDHSEGLWKFFDYFRENQDKIVPYLLEGMTFTGNDNIAEDEIGSNQREQQMVEHYTYKNGKSKIILIDNPYYNENNDNYIWIHKGN